MCVCRQVMLVWKCVCVCTQAHTAARCHAPWALFKNYNIEQQQETHKNQTKYCIDKHIWWHNNNKRDKNSNNVQSNAVQRNCLLTFVNICFCHVFCCAVVLLFCCLMQRSLHLPLSLTLHISTVVCNSKACAVLCARWHVQKINNISHLCHWHCNCWHILLLFLLFYFVLLSSVGRWCICRSSFVVSPCCVNITL